MECNKSGIWNNFKNDNAKCGSDQKTMEKEQSLTKMVVELPKRCSFHDIQDSWKENMVTRILNRIEKREWKKKDSQEKTPIPKN